MESREEHRCSTMNGGRSSTCAPRTMTPGLWTGLRHSCPLLGGSGLRALLQLENMQGGTTSTAGVCGITTTGGSTVPVKKTKGGYRWGKTGKVYPTKIQAQKQGQAIKASQSNAPGRKR